MREVNGVDVLAREACYHNTYRREYTRCVGPQKADTQSTEDAKGLEAHRQAFAHIREYVERQIIQGLHVKGWQCCMKDTFLFFRCIVLNTIMLTTKQTS